jgi:hypothetical protein
VEPYRTRRTDALIDIGERLRTSGLIFNFKRLRILASDCSRREAPAADNRLAGKRPTYPARGSEGSNPSSCRGQGYAVERTGAHGGMICPTCHGRRFVTGLTGDQPFSARNRLYLITRRTPTLTRSPRNAELIRAELVRTAKQRLRAPTTLRFSRVDPPWWEESQALLHSGRRRRQS